MNYDSSQLAAQFATFRADAFYRFNVKVRRKRAEQLRHFLSYGQAIDLDTFNREVWVYESGTIWHGEQINLNNLIFNRTITEAQLAEYEQAFDAGEMELHGNYTWGSGSATYGAMLPLDAEGKTVHLHSALEALNAPGVELLTKANLIMAVPGFGRNTATGLVMLFHPTEFAIYNKEPEQAFQKLGLPAKTLEEFQDSARLLKEQLGADDFIELDWFLYNFNRDEMENQTISQTEFFGALAKVCSPKEKPEAQGETPLPSGKIWKIAPGDKGMYWRECHDGQYICVGWDELGDLTELDTKEKFIEATKEEFEKLYSHAPKRSAKINELWNFRSLKPGDVIVANNGMSEILGVGDVIEPGYKYRPERPHMKNTVTVKWRPFSKKTISPQKRWGFQTVAPVSEKLYRVIMSADPSILSEDNIDYLDEIIDEIASEYDNQQLEETPTAYEEPPFAGIVQSITAHKMRLDEQTLRRYHLSLKTRGFVILSGLSGSGKTWLARLYAEAVGAQCEIVPVAPNWTANEDLLGFWNPLAESYQDTRFSRFLRRAGDHYQKAQAAGVMAQPFHLVLDEMNLARVEYYFAKFLSGLEVRVQGATTGGAATIELGPDELVLLPPNLFFVGTVNMDETTHSFADKVYDRAQLIEMKVSRESLEAHLADKPHAEITLQIWDAIHQAAPFAFRVLDEIDSYLHQAAALNITWQEAYDEQLLHKILPKFKGADGHAGEALREFVQLTKEEFPLAHQKSSAMMERFQHSGFVSYF
jgi:hypothetical protein